MRGDVHDRDHGYARDHAHDPVSDDDHGPRAMIIIRNRVMGMITGIAMIPIMNITTHLILTRITPTARPCAIRKLPSSFGPMGRLRWRI